MSSGDMVDIGICISERLSANQHVFYAYANHVPTGHNTNISKNIRKKPMLISPLEHKINSRLHVRAVDMLFTISTDMLSAFELMKNH